MLHGSMTLGARPKLVVRSPAHLQLGFDPDVEELEAGHDELEKVGSQARDVCAVEHRVLLHRQPHVVLQVAGPGPGIRDVGLALAARSDVCGVVEPRGLRVPHPLARYLGGHICLRLMGIAKGAATTPTQTSIHRSSRCLARPQEVV